MKRVAIWPVLWCIAALAQEPAKPSFDVVSIRPGNGPPGATREQFIVMLQNMLEERFNLKFHHESKEFSAYNLVLAKSGLKLKDSIPTDACSRGARPVGGTCPEGVEYQSGIAPSKATQSSILNGPRDGGRLVSGTGTEISAFANMLESQLRGSVVIDKTGLTGHYDFRFEYAPPTLTGADANPPDDTPLPSLFTALEHDLGLKLESTKTMLDVLVIDRITAPTEN